MRTITAINQQQRMPTPSDKLIEATVDAVRLLFKTVKERKEAEFIHFMKYGDHYGNANNL